MWFQVGIIFLVVAFFMYLGTTFGASVASLIINGVIIFVIVYRSYFEIQAGRIWHHVTAAIAAILLVFYFGSSGAPFWTLTLYLIMEYLLALLFHIVACRFPHKKIKPGKLTRKYH